MTDVHTEHCCLHHGCKYGNKDCTVTSGQLEQSYPCEECEYDPPFLSEDMLDSIDARDALEYDADLDDFDTAACLEDRRRLLREVRRLRSLAVEMLQGQA